jgi:hypothetical protein
MSLDFTTLASRPSGFLAGSYLDLGHHLLIVAVGMMTVIHARP